MTDLISTDLLAGLHSSLGLFARPFLAAESAEPGSNFQPYIFWAYGAAFAILLLFSAYSLYETRQLSERISYLSERFRAAHPEHDDKR